MRQGPSFRPNLNLSHMVYKGPETRDYTAAIERIRCEVEGGRQKKHTEPPPPDPSRNFYRPLMNPDRSFDAFIAIMVVLALTIGVLLVLNIDPFRGH